jgi:hypothetical protein
MLPDQAHRMGERVWMGAAGVLALGVFVPLMAPDMGLGLAPADPPVPLDPAVRLLVGPGLGAPGGPGWLGSSLLARLALLLPVGTPSTLAHSPVRASWFGRRRHRADDPGAGHDW